MANKAGREEYLKKYYQEHKEERVKAIKEWRKEHPEKIREYNHRQYLKRKAQKEAEAQK